MFGRKYHQVARPPNFPNLPCKSATLGLLFTLVTGNFITGKALPTGELTLHGISSVGYDKREAYPKYRRIQYLIISLSTSVESVIEISDVACTFLLQSSFSSSPITQNCNELPYESEIRSKECIAIVCTMMHL